jgi:nucleotidyltransferase/DNA polymerase involved in DNA repair
MERAVAIKKLGKLLGKKLGYRVNDKAPTQDEREVAKAAIPAAVEERDATKAKRDERYKSILEADAEYQGLLVAHRTARERVDKLFSITRHYKFTVGTCNGMFFHVQAEGDSWEEIIGKLTTEKHAA